LKGGNRMTHEKIIVHIDDEDLIELAPVYLAKQRAEMAVLRDAVAKRDFGALLSFGHKIKGSGGGFGFDRISEIGSNLESAAQLQDMPAIEREIAALQNYLDHVEIAG